MIIKPSYWDIRYSNVPSKDKEMLYQRDLMLYEQTVALNEINKKQNTEDVDSSCLRGIDTQTLELLSRLHANGRPHRIIEIHPKPRTIFLNIIKELLFFLFICIISISPFLILANM